MYQICGFTYKKTGILEIVNQEELDMVDLQSIPLQ
jgi:hypothetical protein